ncbi:hypothetical protein CASFOL_029419 [Castilleja foliolosa]|uniref:Uncharacterized protein n=1 Tax=Castilleja foliolosa TaxID=1961234 RepID=A0ABD3CA55_9LAMI
MIGGKPMRSWARLRANNRSDIQQLKNKIPANVTNIAMADVLKALKLVEGIEEFMQQCQSGTAQSSIGSLEVPQYNSFKRFWNLIALILAQNVCTRDDDSDREPVSSAPLVSFPHDSVNNVTRSLTDRNCGGDFETCSKLKDLNLDAGSLGIILMIKGTKHYVFFVDGWHTEGY